MKSHTDVHLKSIMMHPLLKTKQEQRQKITIIRVGQAGGGALGPAASLVPFLA